MSVSYWALQGYGVNVEGEIFDLDKLIKELGLDAEDYQEDERAVGCIDDMWTVDIFDAILAKPEFLWHRQYLSIGTTGNNDNGEFIFYCPNYPWYMSQDEKNMTQDRIEQMLVDVLLKVTIWTEEEIREKFEDISTGGEG